MTGSSIIFFLSGFVLSRSLVPAIKHSTAVFSLNQPSNRIALFTNQFFVLGSGKQFVNRTFYFNLDHPALAIGVIIHFFRTSIKNGIYFQHLAFYWHKKV